jgi:hypothetical protein
MSILGIYASQISGHLGNFAYESIQTVTVGSGGASSVSFSSIPSTYKHLQVRCMTRGTSNNTCPVYLRVNGDTGTSYSTHQVLGNGATAYADNHPNASYILDGWGGFQSFSGGDLADTFGVGIIDLLDYSSTSIYKTARALWGRDNNSSGSITGRVVFESGSWRNTAAINSLTFVTDATYGITWAEKTTFALYGVKG